MSTTEDDLTKEPASGNALPKKRVKRIRNRLAQAAQGVYGALGLRGPSEEEIAAEKKQWERAVRARFESVYRQSEGINGLAMTILDVASSIPNQTSTSPLSGHEWHDGSGQVDHQWVLPLSFGGVPQSRATNYSTPLLIERGGKPTLVFEGMTTPIDTAVLTLSAEKREDGSYGEPRTSIYLNGVTRESDGLDFENGLLDGTSNPTGTIGIDVDDTGKITELRVGRNNQTGLHPESVSDPHFIVSVQTMLTGILNSVSQTAEAYKQLEKDME